MAWLCKSRKRCDAILMQDDLYVFRGARGDLIKILWHDGLGMSLYAKRLDRGRFIWPSATEGAVSISAAQWLICWKVSTGEIRN
jgi:transposase